MKTKITLFFGTLVIAGMSIAGPSDSAAFAVRHAQQDAAAANGVATVSDNGTFTLVPSPSGKGVVQNSNHDEAVTNVALVKSSKAGSCASGACSLKR